MFEELGAGRLDELHTQAIEEVAKLKRTYSRKKAALYYALRTPREHVRRWLQILSRGFPDSDTWCLDSTIAEFVLPRLRHFKEVNIGYVEELGDGGWDEVLDKMIWSFEYALQEDRGVRLFKSSAEEVLRREEKFAEGMALFAKYFRHLWW